MKQRLIGNGYHAMNNNVFVVIANGIKSSNSLRVYIAFISSKTDPILSPYPENKQFSWLLALAENKEKNTTFSEALNLRKNLADK